ncbi:hypothetical protein GQ105_004969 [Salmonella enterica]|nr:hypothetical protein [Salmonella enterica]
MVVRMGVLTNNYFCFSLLISQLMAMAIPPPGTISLIKVRRSGLEIPHGRQMEPGTVIGVAC